ncbi:MAG: hypothetical protein SFX73_06910 [Kofleriaceae bacterium]|nr:hypothetical protein [Kofleriaceae bacterium]
MRSSILALLVLLGCSSQPYELDDRAPCPTLGAVCDVAVGDAPAVTAPTVVAPSETLPSEVVSQVSHNNLDIVWFRGRLFFAFRTGPYHFASDKVVMYVVSTTDQVHWEHEATFDLDTDLREPRFLVVDDRLFLYFAVLGDSFSTFDPKEARRSEYTGQGEWSASEVVFEAGFIPWRTKTIDGAPSVIGYVGGENIYQPDGEPVRVSWLTTDGETFAPATDREVVLVGGSSETDLVTLDDGTVIAVSRNELGDETGWGSKICRAEASAPGDWRCIHDPKKYDSPLMFRHGSDVYLIARRQVANDGNYDLMLRDLPPEQQKREYDVKYWTTPKRCALWTVDPASLAVGHVLDLPSSGDTCFPGLVELGGGRYLVYDYTSPLDHDVDRAWVDGQTGPTEIHSLVLSLP